MSARKAPRRPKAHKPTQSVRSIGTPHSVVDKRLVALQHRVYQMAGICHAVATASSLSKHRSRLVAFIVVADGPAYGATIESK